MLADLANDERFHGTIICSIVPGMFFAPGGPLMENSEKALKRYRDQTLAQRASHHLGMFLEERVAFLKQEDLTLEATVEDACRFRTVPTPRCRQACRLTSKRSIANAARA